MTDPDRSPVDASALAQLIKEWRAGAAGLAHGFYTRAEVARAYCTCADELESALAAPRAPLDPREGELEGVIAQLRHAYAQLKAIPDVEAGRLNTQSFADGLIAPQIRKLEALAARARPALGTQE